ncbi:MAG: MFS transporter [Antricoccus sp.]
MSVETPTRTTKNHPDLAPHAWRTLTVLLIGIVMSLIDASIVNVALPSIRVSLNANEATLSWIVSGYALSYGLALIPAGRLGDKYGHKWIFVGGLALFTLASLACGLAQNDFQLVAARIVQGLAGGIYFPAVTAFIQLLFGGRVRGKAFAVLGAVIGVSTAIGPLVGGLIIQLFGQSNGWRLVFGVNLPIGIVGVILAIAMLPLGREKKDQAESAKRGGVDAIGLVLLAGGLTAILVPLIEGQTEGWPLWTYLSLAAGVLLLVLLAFWELAYQRRGRTPLLAPRIFAHPSFSFGVLLALVYFAAFVSIFFVISLFWQSGLGHTALESGIVSVPFAIGSIVGASQSNRLAQRLGRVVLSIGTALVAVGLIALWLVLLLHDPQTLTTWDLLGPLLVAGIGSGLFVAPNTQFIVATVERSEAGSASGVLATSQRIGSAIGIAVVGSVFFSNLPTFRGRPTPAQLANGFQSSVTAALMISASFAVVAFLLVFVLPKRASGRPSAAGSGAADGEATDGAAANDAKTESDSGPKHLAADTAQDSDFEGLTHPKHLSQRTDEEPASVS